jgi:hypothetical protein
MSPQLYIIQKQVIAFLAKHHPVIFIAGLGLFLSGGILYMYQVIQPAFAEPNVAVSSIKDFDKSTIEKIKNLRDSTTGGIQANFSCPRINPFAEQHIHCIYLIAGQLANYKAANKNEIPSSATLCTFVKTYLKGTSCTVASQNYTDNQGKTFTVQYRYVPKAFNEIGYWNSSVCAAKSPNGFAASADPNSSVLIVLQTDQTMLCVDS